MPTYLYKCKCGEFELKRSFKDYRDKEKCPKCGKLCKQIISCPHFNIISEPSTVRQLSEKNTREMGKYELEDRIRKDKNEKQEQRITALKRKKILPEDYKLPENTEPWYGTLDKKKKKELFSGTKAEQKKKVKRYIQKGI